MDDSGAYNLPNGRRAGWRWRVVLAALVLTASAQASGQVFTDRPRADSRVSVQHLLGLAEQGDTRAAFLLGTRYASGRAGTRDDSEAARWFTIAAEKGLAEAQYNLGVMYASGRGVPRDLAQAARWYRLAAEQGTAEAQYNLGTLYALGMGVEQHEGLAAKWFAKAAGQDVAAAQYNLGVLYEHGRGVSLDAGQALRWYGKAAAQGYGKASERLSALQTRLKTGNTTTPVSRRSPVRAVPAPASPPPTAMAVAAKARQPEPDPSAGSGPQEGNALLGTDWLAQRDPGRFTMQLTSRRDRQSAADFIRRHGLETRAALFSSEKSGVTWYSVVYGDFASIEAAKAARTALPRELSGTRPWVRKFAVVQKIMLR